MYGSISWYSYITLEITYCLYVNVLADVYVIAVVPASIYGVVKTILPRLEKAFAYLNKYDLKVYFDFFI